MIKSIIKLHVHCVLLMMNIAGWCIIYEYMISENDADQLSNIGQIKILKDEVDVVA